MRSNYRENNKTYLNELRRYAAGVRLAKKFLEGLEGGEGIPFPAP